MCQTITWICYQQRHLHFATSSRNTKPGSTYSLTVSRYLWRPPLSTNLDANCSSCKANPSSDLTRNSAHSHIGHRLSGHPSRSNSFVFPRDIEECLVCPSTIIGHRPDLGDYTLHVLEAQRQLWSQWCDVQVNAAGPRGSGTEVGLGDDGRILVDDFVTPDELANGDLGLECSAGVQAV